ncbi:hypothetical protein Bbelb_009910 [Branchiostoma belcheri]|nr:hypothetical protein Bbelb_009910 [Branchiostoma belcheri]
MEVSPGVTVREGSRVKKGPRQLPRKYDIITPTTQHALRPLTDSAKINPEVLVQEILARSQCADDMRLGSRPYANEDVLLWFAILLSPLNLLLESACIGDFSEPSGL